jgi:hypothetical protein
MDSLWTPYGLPMDYLWNNTGATRLQQARSAGASRSDHG